MKKTWLSLLFFYLYTSTTLGSNDRLGELLKINHTHTYNNAMAINSEDDDNWIEPTPSQPKGPFYPISFPDDTGSDLTSLNNINYAKGIKVYIQGQVMNAKGTPITGAKVEIWQACQSGKYNHPNDSNLAPIDPHFQYYGTTNTSSTGKYIFKTIVPGPYPASNNWWRPPHIHFMVTAPGYKKLITQLYFNGDSFKKTISIVNDIKVTGKFIKHLNEIDFLINRIPKEKRQQLIVTFKDFIKDNKKSKIGVFNLYLDDLK